MSLKSPSSKNSFKNSLNGLKIIALVGASSMLFTNCVIASDLNSTTKSPTTYAFNNAPQRDVPVGYVKGDYKAVSLKSKSADKLYTPSADELSLQQAAEIVAQDLFKFYDVKLTGQTLDMYYAPKDNKKDYSDWFAVVKVTPNYCFELDIDAITGELKDFICQGEPNFNKPAASEDEKTITDGMSLAKKGLADPNAACAQVKTLLTQKGFISEPIETIEYRMSVYGTHYAVATPYSDITHSFNVITASKTTYIVSTSQDLSTIVTFFKKNPKKN